MRMPALCVVAACALAGVAAGLLLSGCGGVRAADLFLLQRSGNVAGAKLTLLVNEEGGVRCNGARTRKLSDPQLIEARVITEDLRDAASHHLSLAPRPGAVLSYDVLTEKGRVRFADNSAGQPDVLHRLALFVLRTAQQVCGLPM